MKPSLRTIIAKYGHGIAYNLFYFLSARDPKLGFLTAVFYIFASIPHRWGQLTVFFPSSPPYRLSYLTHTPSSLLNNYINYI